MMDISDALRQGKLVCIRCGTYQDTVLEAKQHDLAYHYDYVLMQMSGNHRKVREWASEE